METCGASQKSCRAKNVYEVSGLFSDNSVTEEKRNKKNSGYSLLGPALESTQRRICLNFLPWPCCLKPDKVYFSMSDRVTFLLFQLRDLCLPEREWRVSLLLTLLRLRFPNNMTKAINQYNFHKVRLTGSAFLTNALLLRLNNNHSGYARPDEMHTWSCSKYLTYSKRLNYSAGKNQINIATNYRMSYPFCRCLSIHARQ